MPKKQPDTSIVQLPEILNGENFRGDVVPYLALVRKNKKIDIETMHSFNFSPPQHIRQILIDCSKIKEVTAVGICELLSTLHWIRSNAHNIQISSRHGEQLSKFNINDEFLPSPKLRSATSDNILFSPICVRLPRMGSLGDPSLQNDRDILTDKVRKIVTELLTNIELHDNSFALRTLVTSVISEGVLNAYEHAYVLGEAHLEPTVWIAATLRKIGRTWRRWIDAPWGDYKWTGVSAQAGCQALLEIAIVDNGVGVPETLGPTYRRQLGLKGPSTKASMFRLHDDILEFAFTPGGSRKSTADFRSPYVRAMWRGLYRVLYRSKRINAYTFIGSGAGQYGKAFLPNEEIRIRSSDIARQSRHNTIPGTTLCLRVALPIHDTDATEVPSTLEAVMPLSESIFVSSQEALLHRDASTSVQAFEIYATHAGRDVLQQFQHNIGKDDRKTCRATLIVHPSVVFNRMKAFTDHVASNDEIWGIILGMIAQSTFPGFVPVHCLLQIPDDSFTAQHMFSDVCRVITSNVTPAMATLDELDSLFLCGIYDSSHDRIIWLIHAPDGTGGQLVGEGRLVAKLSAEPAWWPQLQKMYPGWFATVRRGENVELVSKLPRQIPVTGLQGALSAVVPLLAQRRDTYHVPWFWESRGSEHELMRTASGRLVTQFLSAYSLCVAEPPIEAVITAILVRYIQECRQHIGQEKEVHIVSDTTTASYLLAKQLHRTMKGMEYIVVVHPEDARLRRDEGNITIVFADAVHTANRIQLRCREIAGARSVHMVFACLDLRPEGIAVGIEDVKYEASIRWAFKPPFSLETPNDKRPIIYTVDGLTNAILTNLDIFQGDNQNDGLIWTNTLIPSNDTNPVSLGHVQRTAILRDIVDKPGVFSLGLREIDGRIHSIGCNTAALLQVPIFLEVVTEWLADTVVGLDNGHGRDVVLFVRDESVLRDYRYDITKRAASSVLRRVATKRGRWFTATMPAIRRGHRQTLVHHPLSNLAEAVRVDLEQQLPLGFEEYSDQSLATGFIGIFLDNAAVSGRAIHDFVIGMTEVKIDPKPSMVAVLPILSRLSPLEENVFLKTVSFRTDYRQGTETDTISANIPFYFNSLLQLRVGTYESIESVPIITKLRDLINKIGHIWRPEGVRQWIETVRRQIHIFDVYRMEPKQYFMCAANSASNVTVTVNVLIIRQLLALHQQGKPVIESLVNRVISAITTMDFAFLVMLAIEPHLLDIEIFSGALSRDIAGLAILGLKSDNPGVKASSLWILFCQKSSFFESQRTIAETCIVDAELWAEWLVLMKAYEGRDRGELFTRASEKIARLRLTIPKQDEALRVRISDTGAALLLWGPAHQRRQPTSEPDARAAIYGFLREGRSRHGKGGFASWWTIASTYLLAHTHHENACKKIKSGPEWEEDWNAAKKFLAESIINVIGALVLLPDYQIEDGINIANRTIFHAVCAFDQADAALRDNNNELFARYWTEVLSSSIMNTVEVLFSAYKSCVLGLRGAQLQYGFLDYWLPNVVQEPMGLMLFSLDHFAGAGFSIQVTRAEIDGTRLPNVPVTFEKGNGGTNREAAIRGWLTRVWMEGSRLSLRWNGIAQLRELARMVAMNVRQHGDVRFPCELSIVVKSHGEDFEMKISVSDRPQEPQKPGRGNGHTQLRKLAAALQGRFDFSTAGGVYVANTHMQVHVLDLDSERE